MKARQLSAVAALLCFSSICLAEPQEQTQQEQQEPFTLVKVNKGTKAGRPKAPDRQVVTCAYDGEELHLSFVYSEGTATLSVTDETLLTSTYVIDTTPLVVSVPVGELVGTVCIEMETESGVNYMGVLE